MNADPTRECPVRATRSGGRTRLAAATLATMAVSLVAPIPAHAFSAPVAAFNPMPANGGRNVALREAGTTSAASVVEFTGNTTSWHPNFMLNLDTASDNYWAAGLAAPQYATILLQGLTAGGTATYLIDRVQVQPVMQCCFNERVKDFAIDVSTTDTLPGSFTTVLAATAADNGRLQEFALPQPVQAKYVKYRPITNRGATCCISTESFRAFTGQHGSATVTFANLSTDADGDITGYEWNFGDGTPVSTEQNPTHTYAAAGTYTVTLTVTDGQGMTNAYSLGQTVQGLPTSTLTRNTAALNEGTFITFTSSAPVVSGGAVQRRVWEWDDGTNTVVSSATGIVSAAHVFADNGSYTVKVWIVDADGDAGSSAMPLTIANVAPTVNVGADRRWAAGERLLYNATVGDPGTLDTRTCVWDYGDGTPPVTIPACSTIPSFDHVYALSAGATTSTTFTATLTATDKDGAQGSDSLAVQIFPQMFRQTGASGITGIYGLAWSPVHRAFVVVRDQTFGSRVALVSPDPARPPRFLSPNLAAVGGETAVAVAPDAGGFDAGDVFVGNGRAGEIVRIRMNDDGSVEGIDNPWVTVRSTGQLRGGMTFDEAGTFGNDLLAVFSDGRIYRIDSNRTFGLVEDLRVFLEGAGIASAGFGPAAGCLLTTEPTARNLWAVCPTGNPFVVETFTGGPELEGVTVAESAGDFAVADPDQAKIWLAPSTYFATGLAGHALVHAATTGDVYDVSYDPATETYQATLFTLGVRPAGGATTTVMRMEQATFVPALRSPNASLAPAAATRAVGETHTVTATLVDTLGNPVPGVDVSFTVTGANSAAGAETTDGDGLVSFTYTGTAAGADAIVAATGSAVAGPISAVWGQIATSLDASPVVAFVSPAVQTVYAPNLTATLTTSAGGVVGRTVGFYVGAAPGTLVCTAVTGTGGVASCQDPAATAQALANLGFEARFAGDPTYLASSDAAPLARLRVEE